MDYIPALSLSPPWSELILHGGKPIENRRWRSRYRGPIILHNAKSRDVNRASEFLHERFADADGVLPPEIQRALEMEHPLGYVGVVQFTGEHLATHAGKCCAWGFEDQWHKEVQDPVPFERVIEGGGHQRLFRPTPEAQEYALKLLVDRELPTGVDPYAKANDQGFLF